MIEFLFTIVLFCGAFILLFMTVGLIKLIFDEVEEGIKRKRLEEYLKEIEEKKKEEKRKRREREKENDNETYRCGSVT